MNDRLLSVRDVAAMRGVCPETVYLWTKRPQDPLPVERAGGKIQIRESVLQEWLERKPVARVDAPLSEAAQAVLAALRALPPEEREQVIRAA